ncbi:DUF4097 family beta strand repeat-containing protein [Streptomyces sp. NPDC001922]|uniref:DUF4097 family beta strand repeat-containing protein n=1 Tax=Streptomyces sp. NPDC001922 TaxID=3364624 RepID=UPI0036BA89A8
MALRHRPPHLHTADARTHTDARTPARAGIRTPRGRAGRSVVALGGALLLAVAATGCGSADAAEDNAPERRDFAFRGHALTVVAENTDVELVPADVEKIEVTRWFKGWTAVGGDVERYWRMQGGELRIGVDCDGLISTCDARHVIKVPRAAVVTVKGDNGDLTAKDFGTPLTLASDNGTVRVTGSRGRLDLSSDNGGVSATGIGARRVSARSDNGDVRLAFTRVPDRVETGTDNGGTDVELPRARYRVTAGTDNGDTDVSVPRSDRSGHTVTARSDNGDITVRTGN